MVLSQSIPTYKPNVNNIPTSPEIALLGRFGDIPIGHYTGTANITIPIYTIKEQGVEIPIQLRYHSSGVKINDEATWVGLGWDLSPEGAIIQEVRGLEDSLDGNLNFYSNPQNYYSFKNYIGPISPTNYSRWNQYGCYSMKDCYQTGLICSDVVDDEASIIEALLRGEGQPDIYSYNFGDFSGKFYINPETHQVVLIDKKENIIFEKSNSGFIAKTLDGNKYYFTTLELTAGNIITDYSGKAFKLTNIVLANGKSIVFEYVDRTYTGLFETRRAVFNGNPYVVESPLNGNTEIIRHYNKVLTRIITPEAYIDFNLESRDDINLDPSDNFQRLKSIDISSRVTNMKIKTFEFGYSYFPYNLVGVPLNPSTSQPSNTYTNDHLDTFGKRLKLDNIREIGYDGNSPVLTKPPYQFEYDLTHIMPLKNSFAKDFWGYYNGENNQGLLPDLDYFDYPNKSPIYVDEHTEPFTYNYTKNNRYTNNSYAGAYLLKKIVYPTGGFSLLEYESNSFNNQFIPDKQKNQAAYKLSNIADSNNITDTTVKTFQLSRTTTVNFINSIQNGNTPYGNFTPYTRDQMIGSFIKLIKFDMQTSQATLIKQWDLSSVLNVDFNYPNSGKEWIEQVRIEYDPNPNIRYTVSVHLPNNLTNNTFGSVSVKSQFNYFDDTGVDTSVSSQCGMRIKEIKNYTANDILATHKKFNYYEGKLLNRFEPLEVIDVNYIKCGTSISAIGTYSKRITLTSDNFTANNGNLIGYGKVEEIYVANNSNENIGRKIFYYHNVPNENRKGLPAILNLRNGLVTKEEIFDKFNEKLMVTENVYSYLNPNNISFSGIKVNTHIIGDSERPDAVGMPAVHIPRKYSYDIYAINSEHIMLTSKNITQYFNGQALNSSQTFTYNQNGKIRSLTSDNSHGGQTITKYFYADDYSPSMTYGEMITNNMVGIPLRIEKYTGSSLLSTDTTLFNNFNGLLLPSTISFKKGDSNSTNTVIFDTYDDKGNLLQHHMADGINTCYIYGYNKTLPVAKLENIAYANIPSNLITNIQTITNSPTATEVDIQVALDALRLSTDANMQKALITTYRYKPLVGVTNITDPKGDFTTYIYDDFNRLKEVRDRYNNIISEHEYHYKTQN